MASFLPDHFLNSTRGVVGVQIEELPVVRFPLTHDTSDVRARFPYLEETHLLPVWYYENSDYFFLDLVSNLADEQGLLIIVTTDAQIEGLGLYRRFGNIRLAIVERTSLGGWSRFPYAVLRASDQRLADVATHEIGHYFGLGHKCEEQTDDVQAYCNACPGADDVMSYCRDRDSKAINTFSEEEISIIIDHL